MIIRVNCISNMNSTRMMYEFWDESEGSLIAKAVNMVKEDALLEYGGKQYQFFNKPQMLERKNLKIQYPTVSKSKKAIGFCISDNNSSEYKYYREVVKCKGRLLKKRLAFTVVSCLDEVFMVFKVGYANKSSHFYCILNNNMDTVAIIERHSLRDDNCKAQIYLEDIQKLEHILVICTEMIVDVSNFGGKDYSVDTSAGNYISILEEEKEMFDETFYNRVKSGI